METTNQVPRTAGVSDFSCLKPRMHLERVLSILISHKPHFWAGQRHIQFVSLTRITSSDNFSGCIVKSLNTRVREKKQIFDILLWITWRRIPSPSHAIHDCCPFSRLTKHDRVHMEHQPAHLIKSPIVTVTSDVAIGVTRTKRRKHVTWPQKEHPASTISSTNPVTFDSQATQTYQLQSVTTFYQQEHKKRSLRNWSSIHILGIIQNIIYPCQLHCECPRVSMRYIGVESTARFALQAR